MIGSLSPVSSDRLGSRKRCGAKGTRHLSVLFQFSREKEWDKAGLKAEFPTGVSSVVRSILILGYILAVLLFSGLARASVVDFETRSEAVRLKSNAFWCHLVN